MMFDLDPIAGELTPIFANLYRLCANNPSMMTGPGTNTYIYGKNELAVFDAGPALDSHIHNILRAQDHLGAPITRLFSSHTHSDHSPAVAFLCKELPSVEVIGLPAPIDQDYEDHTFVATSEPRDMQIYVHDGQEVQVVHTPGHVANHVCFLLKEHQFLTTGDHLMQGSTVVIIPPKGNMKAYIESLHKLRDLDIKVMGPGHGKLMDTPLETIDWTIKHRLAREKKVLDCLATFALNTATIDQLVHTVYDDVDRALHPIAKLSLHAHLLKLKEEAVVLENDGSWQLKS